MIAGPPAVLVAPSVARHVGRLVPADGPAELVEAPDEAEVGESRDARPGFEAGRGW